MVISLYVSEIPKNISKEDMAQLFKTLEGFKEIRMKVSNNDKRKIAFVDYDSDSEAKFAQETLQGFKFSAEDKGIHIKLIKTALN
jgi:RNA recognition motif-containing protein